MASFEEEVDPSSRAGPTWWARVVLAWALVLGIDQGTKQLALAFLPTMSTHLYPYGGWALLEKSPIQLALLVTLNPGAAWGFFEGFPKELWLIRAGLLLGLGTWVLRGGPLRFSRSARWACVLLVGAALSNWLDSCARGHVVDMISVTFWGYPYPVFNVADSLICLCATTILLTRLPCSV